MYETKLINPWLSEVNGARTGFWGCTQRQCEKLDCFGRDRRCAIRDECNPFPECHACIPANAEEMSK